MREIRMSGSMRGRRKRAVTYRACILLYNPAPPTATAIQRIEAMDYPSGFPHQCRVGVEGEELRASRDFDQARQSLPWSKGGPGEELEADVLSVFGVHRRLPYLQTCGSQMERVRQSSCSRCVLNMSCPFFRRQKCKCP